MDSVSTKRDCRSGKMDLCAGLRCDWGRSFYGGSACLCFAISWARIRCDQPSASLFCLRDCITCRRALCFRVRQVRPFFSLPQGLSKAATSRRKAGNEGCGVGHFRPVQTRSSTRHIHRITATFPADNGIWSETNAVCQADRHAEHGRMDGINAHQRLSLAMRSSRVRRL